ncbi:MAG: hypothetical protein ABL879_18920 [Devosia sp.]
MSARETDSSIQRLVADWLAAGDDLARPPGVPKARTRAKTTLSHCLPRALARRAPARSIGVMGIRGIGLPDNMPRAGVETP